jgi:ribulose-phosphate 3-epimerase
MTRSFPVKISPSMMCADLWHLEDQVRQLERAGVDFIHFDLMDAHYVPNMPVGLVMLEQVRAHTELPFDVHLMVEDNDFFVQKLAPIGVRCISVHAESAVHLDRTLAVIRSRGIQAGVALNPATPLSTLEYVVEQMDFVLIMTVNPGFAGQQMVPSALRKIYDCCTFLKDHGADIPIEVDGNVSFEKIPHMVAAGADILVAGTSSIFHKDGTLEENAARARQVIAQGLKMREDVRGGR